MTHENQREKETKEYVSYPSSKSFPPKAQTWQEKLNSKVEENQEWFLFHDKHPGENDWQRETRLAKYCRHMAKRDVGKPSNYWDRQAESHAQKATELLRTAH
jgi:hypothetical protein